MPHQTTVQPFSGSRNLGQWLLPLYPTAATPQPPKALAPYLKQLVLQGGWLPCLTADILRLSSWPVAQGEGQGATGCWGSVAALPFCSKCFAPAGPAALSPAAHLPGMMNAAAQLQPAGISSGNFMHDSGHAFCLNGIHGPNWGMRARLC